MNPYEEVGYIDEGPDTMLESLENGARYHHDWRNYRNPAVRIEGDDDEGGDTVIEDSFDGYESAG